MADSNDLSEYERIRIENIRRNADFLSTLGFQVAANNQPVVSVDKKPKSISNEIEKKKKKRSFDDISKDATVVSTRYSLRSRSANTTKEINEIENKEEIESNEDEEEDLVDYESTPYYPQNLDDFEFEIYVSLKAWRLTQSRELGLEAYKVFHNEALCDMTRRKRNNNNWGCIYTTVPGISDIDTDVDKETDNLITRDQTEVSNELQECRGVGPSKSRFVPEKGFAVKIVRDVLENRKNQELFEKSRKLSNKGLLTNNDKNIELRSDNECKAENKVSEIKE